MRVVIRADASVDIGTGHVMRCLAIADGLRETGTEVVFVSRDQEGNLCDFIEGQKFPVLRLPRMSKMDWHRDADQTAEAVRKRWPTADWLIVDHYKLDRRWEILCRIFCDRIFVIDDLADREHDCDLLLDQNYCLGLDRRYADLAPSTCRLLLGPEYALLRPEFLQARTALRQRDGVLKRLLVFFGGSDPTNETAKALEGVRQMTHPDLSVDVVVGSSNPHREQIRTLCDALPNSLYHCQVNNMAELMAKADLAIGAGGITTWERCCLGLPALVSILADNQAELTQAVSEYGASVSLGRAQMLVPECYRHALEAITSVQLVRMEQRCIGLVDGHGTGRIVDVLAQLEKQD